MKKLLMLLLIIPMISFSQVSSWRTTTSQASQSTQSRVQTATPPQNNVSSWRNNPPQQLQPNPHVVEVVFRIGMELTSLVIIGVTTDGINLILILGMMIMDGDKEV